MRNVIIIASFGSTFCIPRLVKCVVYKPKADYCCHVAYFGFVNNISLRIFKFGCDFSGNQNLNCFFQRFYHYNYKTGK